MPTNDNDLDARAAILRPADAHGQAALILVESLLHGLITRSVLTTEESLNIVTSAADVQADYAADADETKREMLQSHTLLTRIAESLGADIVLPPGAAADALKPTLVDLHRSIDAASGAVSPDQGDGADE